MEYKVNALMLRAADYGESDKILTLFSAERGKLTAKIKGVKSPRARLNFAAQPFCFAEYVLASRGEHNTVTGAFLHDGFYKLRERVEWFYAGASVLELCDKLLYAGMTKAKLFTAAIKALSQIGETPYALLSFFIEALRLAGYPVQASANCPVCQSELTGAVGFHMEQGTFCCAGCGGAKVSAHTYSLIKSLIEGSAPNLPEALTADGERRALKLLSAYCNRQTELTITALEEYIRLI